MGVPVAEYKSKSKPGRTYVVQRGADGVIYCDCWQWKINKTCKHTKDYLANMNNVVKAVEKITKNDIDPLQEAINDAVAFMKGER